MRLRGYAAVGMVFTIAVLALAIAAGDDRASQFFFADFEPARGWTAGPLEPDASAIRVVQGKVEIVRVEEDQSTQVLELKASEPFTAGFLDAGAIGSSGVVFCEFLVRPFATQAADDEEFVEFAGAVLGFFRAGDRGEIHALFGQTRSESIWISTGKQFELDREGVAAQWLRITIRLDRSSGRWDLAINGAWELAGLRSVSGASRTVPLWLYGHKTHGNRFDDLLLSSIDPAHLEDRAGTADRRARTGSAASAVEGSKKVTQRKQNAELRRPDAEPPSQPSPPRVRGWQIGLDTGTQTYPTRHFRTDDKDEPGILAYAPGVDDEGRRLPAVITITADAELRPGVDLSKLRWRVAELKGWPDKIGETAGEGDFRTGLVQHFTLSPEWTRKATRVDVWVER